LDLDKTEQGPGYGAIILAMVGCGVYNEVRSAADELVSVCSTVQPEEALVELYNERYSKFRQIYPAMKNLFAELV
ncbi:MAG: hypothetical protein II544_06100, partial [Spirochaetales bacterium]|nr:hypothetical protein [Spirochaetales bacterium]